MRTKVSLRHNICSTYIPSFFHVKYLFKSYIRESCYYSLGESTVVGLPFRSSASSSGTASPPSQGEGKHSFSVTHVRQLLVGGGRSSVVVKLWRRGWGSF